jgi:hypothetical protein
MKGQSRMDIPESLATLRTQDTGWGQTNTKTQHTTRFCIWFCNFFWLDCGTVLAVWYLLCSGSVVLVVSVELFWQCGTCCVLWNCSGSVVLVVFCGTVLAVWCLLCFVELFWQCGTCCVLWNCSGSVVLIVFCRTVLSVWYLLCFVELFWQCGTCCVLWNYSGSVVLVVFCVTVLTMWYFSIGLCNCSDNVVFFDWVL